MFNFRALQGHSGRNFIRSFIAGQCCNSERILPYSPFWMCVQSSLYHQLWMNIWRFRIQARDKQYSFFPVDSRDKSHKDLDKIDLNVPRRPQYLHNAWKRHQDAVYWVDITGCDSEQDWHSMRLDRMQSSFKEHFQLVVFQKLLDCRLEKSSTKKVYMSPRSPPKISLKHEWTRELGLKVLQQSEGGNCSTTRRRKMFDKPSFSNQPNQLQIQFVIDQCDLISCKMKKTSRSQEINVNTFNEELSSSDRTGRLVETWNSNTLIWKTARVPMLKQTHDRSGRSVATLNTAEVQDSSRVRCAHES